MRRTRVLAAAAALALSLPLVHVATADGGPDELADYPRPTVTGKWLADFNEAFSSGHPLRITGTPTQLFARDALAAEAKTLGYTVETTSYKGVLTSVTATKLGTDKPDEHIVFGAHLDSMVGTVSGTYDDGSGVAAVLGLAKAFKDVPTHRTLVFSWYNGEEEGALGSAEHAAAFKAANKKVSAYLGFDMVGIAWPTGLSATTNKNCLCMWRGSRDTKFDKMLRDVNFGFLGFPSGKQLVSVEGANVRNSDEASWADEGYPTLRWAGQRRAADYPGYHLPNDTMATIDAEAGGHSFYEKGLENTLLSGYYTAAALDLVGTPAPAPVTVPASQYTADRTAAHLPGDGHTH